MLKKKPLALLIIFILTIAIIFFALGKINNKSKSDLVISNNSDIHNKNQPTIATQWQWEKINKNTNQAVDSEKDKKKRPFTAEFVYESLKAVKLDENGNVIHDHDALLSLDEALLRIQNKLDDESLSVLQSIIKDGLPGKAGEQTAKIVGDYYYFLEAKDEFSKTSEALIDPGANGTVEAVVNDEMLYTELQALRDAHLGSEVSNGLFRVSDAGAQYMFESMKLDLNEELSAEEKKQMRLEIEERHVERSVNISDWPERYKAFQDAKQEIISAPFDTKEKQSQLTELLQSHFSSDELERIQYLRLNEL